MQEQLVQQNAKREKQLSDEDLYDLLITISVIAKRLANLMLRDKLGKEE